MEKSKVTPICNILSNKVIFMVVDDADFQSANM